MYKAFLENKRGLVVIIILLCSIVLYSCDSVFEDDLSELNVELNSPSNNASLGNTLVLFSWEPVDEAIEYEVQVASPEFNVEETVVIVDSLLTSTSFTRILPIGEYEWKVKAINSSSETEFTTTSFSITGEGDITSLNVNTIYPEVGQNVNGSELEFSWNLISQAESYTIKIHDFSNQILGNLILSEITSDSTFTSSFIEGEYSWSLQGSNSGNQYSQSTERSFTVDNTAPESSELIQPDNVLFNSSADVFFDWNSEMDVNNNISDSLFIYSIDDQEFVLEISVQDSEYTLNSSEIGTGQFDWSITSTDEAGNSIESEIFLFQINE